MVALLGGSAVWGRSTKSQAHALDHVNGLDGGGRISLCWQDEGGSEQEGRNHP